MTDIIFEAVAMGVDSIIAGAVVTMIVTVLSLNAKLNAYTSMQETYADSVTYYRQYSKYNNKDIVVPDALSALLYYDEGIDIILIDTVIDGADKYAYLYTKIDNEIKRYKFTITPNADGSTQYVKLNGNNVSSGDTDTVLTHKGMVTIITDYYKLTNMKGDAYEVETYAKISADMNSEGMFHAYLLEDLAKVPSGDLDGVYSGGVVTSIWLERIK